MGYSVVTGCIAIIFPRLHRPATCAASVALLQQLIDPDPDQLSGGFHPHIGHHAQIKGSEIVQALPFIQKRIVSIHQKCVIKLMPELLFKGPEAGKINNKATIIEIASSKKQLKTTAFVSVQMTDNVLDVAVCDDSRDNSQTLTAM